MLLQVGRSIPSRPVRPSGLRSNPSRGDRPYMPHVLHVQRVFYVEMPSDLCARVQASGDHIETAAAAAAATCVCASCAAHNCPPSKQRNMASVRALPLSIRLRRVGAERHLNTSVGRSVGRPVGRSSCVCVCVFTPSLPTCPPPRTGRTEMYPIKIIRRPGASGAPLSRSQIAPMRGDWQCSVSITVRETGARARSRRV